jgi:superkiller protein 3
MLGKSLFEAGFYPGAVKMFGLAEKVGGPHRFELMGYWFLVRGERSLALDYYKQAIALGVVSEAVFSNRGALLQEIGQIPEAVEVFEQGLKYFKNSTDILYNLAVARWQQGQMEEVKKLIDRILSINPRHEGAMGLAARLR